MDTIKMNNTESVKIDNTKAVNQPQTPPSVSNTPAIKAEAEEAVFESHKEKQTGERKHTVMYLAGGIWLDSDGKYWCRDQKKNCISSVVLTDADLEKREDIKYMIEYGAMKDIVVD